MESFPEAWIIIPLDGPSAHENVDFVVKDFPEGSSVPHLTCLLCETGAIKSQVSWIEHCSGRKHKRKFAQLEQQQLAWVQESQVPTSFCDLHFRTDQDILDYFVPFRRWHFGKWEVGLSCQLCGTAAFATRSAIIEHCEKSRRHSVLRAKTLWTDYHPEISENSCLKARLSLLPPTYKWHVERSLLHYLAAKERSMASLQSQRYEWYRVWKELELYELRYQMSILECAIWKAHLLQFDDETCLSSMEELDSLLNDRNIDVVSYRRDRRKTNPATAVIFAVIQFLKDEPNPQKLC